MFKKSTCWIVLLYGLLLIAIGLEAYVKKHSLVSLLSGGSLGFLISLSAAALFAQKKMGVYLSIGLLILTTAVFAVRYAVSHSTTPALLCILSGGVLLFLLVQSVRWRNR